MATGNQGRVLRIQHGQELQFHVSRDICCEYSLLNPAYRQAQRALIEILNHTRAFHERTRSASNEEKELFEYGGNIILFAAPRGGGKTRMMLSFSHVLESPQPAEKDIHCLGEVFDNKTPCDGCKNRFFYASTDEQRWLKDSNFFITEPIAPAALEKEQSILYVVLSRLYRYAEKLLKKSCSNGNITESQKNDLRKSFHNCLSGINGLKKPADSVPEDFSVLQDISDGLSLRYHFYRLITNILAIAEPNNKADHRYLVLQVDDADSKIDGVYEVFEDIRKYLLVPNLVILLSADLDFLHRTIAEEHLNHFTTLQRFDGKYAQGYAGELSRVARKYIDKLIPPSHQVNLSEFGRMNGPEVKEVRLDYMKENGEDLLSDIKDGAEVALWNLENSILMLIYRKTGVLFVCPSAYLHNIIPRTHRGINQLLFILDSMADIPKVEYPNLKPDKKTQSIFVGDVLAQVAITQHNLARFSEYFIHDWIKVKIKDSDDREFLNKFSSMANSELTHMTLAYLRKKYDDVQFADSLHARMDRYTLEQAVLLAEKSHRTPEDFLFYFAIRTLLTLNSHRLILLEKKKTLLGVKEGKPFVFNFDDQNAFLTRYIPFMSENQLFANEINLFDTKSEVHELAHAFDINIMNEGFAKISNKNVAQILFSQAETHLRKGSYMNVFLLLLQLGKIVNMDLSVTDQEKLYRLQEYALMIVANWDVYGKLYRETATILENVKTKYAATSNDSFVEAKSEDKLKYLFMAVNESLKHFNGETLSGCVPELNILSVLKKLKVSENMLNYKYQVYSAKVPLSDKITECLTAARKDYASEQKVDATQKFAKTQDGRNAPQEVKVSLSLGEAPMEDVIYKIVESCYKAYTHVSQQSSSKRNTSDNGESITSVEKKIPFSKPESMAIETSEKQSE